MMCPWASYKKKMNFFCVLKINEERSRTGVVESEVRIPGDPDPHQNVTEPNTGKMRQVLFGDRQKV